jgi:diaminopimelate epimerase
LLRTYERGVEDEHSLVVQAPQQLQQWMFRKTDASSIDLNVEGGKLVVSFEKKKDNFPKSSWKDQRNLYLKGHYI